MKMSHPLDFAELRKTLLAQGHSRRYVSRLVDELVDHRESILEDSEDRSPAASTLALRRLGSVQQLVETVEQFPELRSWGQRNPWISFALLPAVMMLTLTALFVVLAEFVVQGDRLDAQWKLLSIRYFHWLPLLSSMLAGISISFFAIRSKVHWSYLLVSTAIVSLAGCYVFELGSCQLSGGGVAYSHPGIDGWKLFSTVMVGLVGISILRFRSIPSVNHDANMALRNRLPAGFAVTCVAILVVFGAVYFPSVSAVREFVKAHPADRLIQQQNSPESRATHVLALLAHPMVRTDLGFDARQEQQTENIIQEWNEFCQNIWESSEFGSPNDPRFREIQHKVLHPRLVKLESRLLSAMNSSQRERIQQLLYQRLRDDAVFLAEFRQELRISRRQYRELKDCFVERIRRRGEERQSVADCYGRDTYNVLTESQRSRWHELCGDQLSPVVLSNRQPLFLSRS